MPYAAFRRQGVPQQYAQALQTTNMPAPTRGIVESENEAYMLPGGALVQDNWASTMRGVKLRGGFVRHCDLHALDFPAWENAHNYTVGTNVADYSDDTVWQAAVAHTSAAAPVTFAEDRAENSSYWVLQPGALVRQPVISGFEYVAGNVQRMYAGQQTKLFDVTAVSPALIKAGQNSGNYSAAQYANAAAVWMIAVNDAGDFPLRYNGTSWVTLDPALGAPTDGSSLITYDPADDPTAADGRGLTYVWKYRNRLYFIQGGTMNAWYLPIDAVGGQLKKIPLSGSATKGGSLLFGASWSIDAGDGIDDKNIFATDMGEILIFTGSNPADPANWRQEGRYALSPPLGMNAHISVGGDLLLLTVDGIVPLSQAITKQAGQLELAMLTRTIKSLWRETVYRKRSLPWTIHKWDEYGALFVATPGGDVGDRWCFVANNATAAWGRFSWDATCFLQMRADLFFGTQNGFVMQGDRTGYDDGQPYVATLVGGWEMFGAPSSEIVWHQMRASFRSLAGYQPFVPQLSATVDYEVVVPQPPPPGTDPGLLDVWDQGKWGPPGSGDLDPPSPADIEQYAQWDQPAPSIAPVRNTGWVSIGMTGFSHAPIVQITVAQQALPAVELLALATTFERAGVNV